MSLENGRTKVKSTAWKAKNDSYISGKRKNQSEVLPGRRKMTLISLENGRTKTSSKVKTES